MNTTTTVTVNLPFIFWEDHTLMRDCKGGEVVKEGARLITVQLDREAFEDLLSDAEHYAGDAMDEFEDRSIRNSAKATLKRLNALDVPAEWRI